ncbi:MAG: hypothetical protein MMC23_005264 [Stictis urceolatum]|nr:hypothetical protein [Stictis urceolata]
MHTPALGSSGDTSSHYGIPLTAPPAGVRVNLTDPESNGAVTLGIGISMIMLSYAFCGLRIAGNLKSRAKFRWDDATRHTHHTWDIDLAYFSTSAGITELKTHYSTAVLLSLSTFTSKLLVLSLFLTSFPTHRTLAALVYFATALCTILYVIVPVGVYSYFCTPGSQDWNVELVGKCKQTTLWGLIQGALDVGIDASLWIMPLPMLVGLKMKERVKRGLVGVFGLGIL